MKSRYDNLANIIIHNVGGKENITAITHCATRLRFTLKDYSKANTEVLNNTEGIVTVIQRRTQYMLVIGSSVVEVFEAVMSLDRLKEYAANIRLKENPGTESQRIKKHLTGTIIDNNTNVVEAPLKGRMIYLSEVDDEAFSSGILGEGCAIVPANGKVYAPCDGTIITFFPSGHAVAIRQDSGAEILIHVGIDTVKLDGKGFSPKKKQGDIVKCGELILEADIDFIEQSGFDITTPVIITNPEDYDIVNFVTGNVEPGNEIIKYKVK